jgi:uncharacterized protein YjdB
MKQEDIDSATANLNSAGEALADHPYINPEDVKISYTTYKKSTSTSQVASGTVGSNDAVSIDLSSSYSNWNDYNYITLTAIQDPVDSMAKSIAWNVDDSYNMSSSFSANSITLTPGNKSYHSVGGWAKITATVTDYYGRIVTRTIYVTMSDNVATGLNITETNLTLKPTSSPYTVNYTLSGSAEFSTILWSSSDESVATVENGVITAVDKGTAVITAKSLDGGYSDTITVEVQTDFTELASKVDEYTNLINNVNTNHVYTESSLAVLSAAVTEAKTIVDEGKATQAEVNASLEVLQAAYDGLIKYEAATGVKIGVETNSYVTVPNEGYARYTGVTLNGKTIQLTYDILPNSNAVYKSITWSSSNENVSVDSFGLVTNNTSSAKASIITCTVEDEFGNTNDTTYVVSFTRYGVNAVEFDSDTIYGAPQEVKKINVNLKQDNTTISSSHVDDCTYTSSNEEVATVDSEGNVTFLTQGTSTITVTALDGGYTGTITAYTTWDTTALQEAIAQGEKLTYTDYAYEQGTAFKAALDSANEVYKNVYASQDEIDLACTNLTTAITNLEGHEFIDATVNATINGEELQNGLTYATDNNSQAVISSNINSDAMIKSAVWTTSSEDGVSADVIDGNLVLTKTADDVGSIKLTLTVTDDYDRVTTYTYSIKLVDSIVVISSINFTIDGVETTESSYSETGYQNRYTDFDGIQLGYVAYPDNATAATNVTWESDASNYVKVDSNGYVSLTTLGTLRDNKANITCTVTNADGSTVSKTITIIITR